MFPLTRPQINRVHAVSGGLAILIISTFLVATLVAELSGDPPFIATVKQTIAYGLLVLVPTMATIGLSGTRLASTSTAPIIQRKRRSMAFIAANGLLVLVPCALILAWLATSGAFGLAFYLVQGVELVAGLLNITLLVLSARLGMRMTRNRRQPDQKAAT